MAGKGSPFVVGLLVLGNVVIMVRVLNSRWTCPHSSVRGGTPGFCRRTRRGGGADPPMVSLTPPQRVRSLQVWRCMPSLSGSRRIRTKCTPSWGCRARMMSTQEPGSPSSQALLSSAFASSELSAWCTTTVSWCCW